MRIKAVIAFPSEPVRKAGARTLHFESVAKCALYFGLSAATVRRGIYGTEGKCRRYPAAGYFFDYEDE